MRDRLQHLHPGYVPGEEKVAKPSDVPVVICGDAGFLERVIHAGDLHEGCYRAFRGGQDCREYLAVSGCACLVVGPHVVDVSPLNLVAAVRRDVASKAERAGTMVRGEAASGEAAAGEAGNPSRGPKIFLCAEGPQGGSFLSRATSAGVDRLVTVEELRGILSPFHGAGADGDSAGSGESQPAGKVGKVLVFTGGAGGSGKTTLALLAAMGLARRGLKTGLVDFDLQFGDIAYLLGIEDEVRTLDELASPDRAGATPVTPDDIRQLVHPISDEVGLIACPRRPERGEMVVPLASDILAACGHVFEVTVVDAGDSWSDATAEILARADAVMIVCDGRTSSLHDSGKAVELCMRLGVPIVRQHVLVNREDPKRGIDEVGAAFALKGVRISAVPDGGREVDELVGLGCPEELFVLRNPVALKVAEIASDVLGGREAGGDLLAFDAGALGGSDRERSRTPFFRKRRRA